MQIAKQIGADTRAQGLPEYSLLVAIIVVAVVTATYLLEMEGIRAIFLRIGDFISNNAV